ncbi:MAG: ABC transporter substrate-binding protein [Desulfosudaceae bacterium]
MAFPSERPVIRKNCSTNLLRFVLLSVLAVAGAGAILLPAGCGSPDPEQADSRAGETPVTVSVGINNSLKSVPIVIAREKGFFAENGLSVSLTKTESAVPLLQMMGEGTLDVVCTPEQLLAFRALKQQDFRILAALNRNQSQELVMNTARGVDAVTDLKGRRIGLKMNSAAPYFLYRLLLYHHLAMDDVELVGMELAEMPEQMAAGKIDAAIAWPPHTVQIRQTLGENIHTVNAHMGRDMYWVLAARAAWCDDHIPALRAFLKALQSAFSFMAASPQESMTIAGSYFGFPPERVRGEWATYHFKLELPQSLLFAMEQEACWRQQLRGQKEAPPDFFALVECRPMKKLCPDTVTIIH